MVALRDSALMVTAVDADLEVAAVNAGLLVLSFDNALLISPSALAYCQLLPITCYWSSLVNMDGWFLL